MKKIYVTFCLVISLAFSVSAKNYQVSNASSSELNGLYVPAGTYNGQPMFLYDDGDRQWAIGFEWDYWAMGEYTNGSINLNIWSYGTGSPPLTGWNVATLTPIETEPIVSYSSFKFLENSANNGSIGTSVTIGHNIFESTSFSGTNGENFATSGKVSITHIPAGLTASLIRNSSLALTLTLTGNATLHSNANEINNLNLQFNDDAFLNSNAAGTLNSGTVFSVDFIDVLTVGAGQAYATIMSAVSAAASRDILLLTAGTFTEPGITVTNKSLTIMGQSPSQTIIQAAATPNTASDKVFHIDNWSYSDDAFFNFEKVTIRNGNSVQDGGGIFALNTTLRIKNCVIESNYVTTPAGEYNYEGGGGIYAFETNLEIENSTFSDNHHVSGFMAVNNPTGGGAIFFYNSEADMYMTITNTTFSNNSAGNSGGAILVLPSSTKNYNIINSTFVGNTAGRGSVFSTNGMVLTPTPVNFKNVIMYGNTATTSGSQFYSEYAIGFNFANCNLENTSNTGAAVGSYSNCQVATNPLLGTLADNGGFTKTYALLSGSPAINAGMSGIEIPSTDQRGYSNSGVKDIGSFEYFPTYTWTGTSGNDWNTAANWSSNTVPDASANVTIPGAAANQPVVLTGGSADCIDLTVNSGASLTVQSDGSLITKGLVSGNISIQRTVEGSSNLDAYKYHLVSVPLAPSNVSQASLFAGSYLYEYLPGINDWSGMGSTTTTGLDETVGYMIYYPNTSSTYTFTGVPNTGAFTPSVTYPGNADGFNFALVPNPYPSNIDWNAATGWTKTNIGSSIWFYNNGNYGVWNGTSGTHGASRYIGVGQAFFVQTTAADPALAMDNGVRTHTAATFLKSGNPLVRQLRVRSDANTMTDELLVGFGETTNNAYNASEDALKLQGAAMAPQLYTMADNTRLSINNLMAFNTGAAVPMNFETGFEGNVTLSFSQMESFPTNLAIGLEDKLIHQFTDLRTQSTYTFAHQSANASDRFVLHFGSATGIDNNVVNNGHIWISEKAVNISSPASVGEKALVEIFNTAGQCFYSTQITLSELTRVPVSLSGFAIVRVSTATKVWVAKGIF